MFDNKCTTAHHVTMDMLSPTVGSQRLKAHFDELGAYNRHRMVLCAEHQSGGVCGKGTACEDVHLIAPISDTQPYAVHYNRAGHKADPSLYPCHEPGTLLNVWDHVARRTEVVESSCVYVTVGSEEYFAKLAQGWKDMPRMQQCTHFQKESCAMGHLCGFLHVTLFGTGTAVTQRHRDPEGGSTCQYPPQHATANPIPYATAPYCDGVGYPMAMPNPSWCSGDHLPAAYTMQTPSMGLLPMQFTMQPPQHVVYVLSDAAQLQYVMCGAQQGCGGVQTHFFPSSVPTLLPVSY